MKLNTHTVKILHEDRFKAESVNRDAVTAAYKNFPHNDPEPSNQSLIYLLIHHIPTSAKS